MVEHYNEVCSRLFTKYYECMSYNIEVFGKDRGPIMCKYVKEILDNSICDNKIKSYKITK